LNLFLDSSVLLAACGGAAGASRVVIESSTANRWQLLSSDYVFGEVEANLGALPSGAGAWPNLREKLQKVPDVLTLEWPAVFAPARDRPILFTAMAWAEVLLTLDRRDFGELLGSSFYGLAILTPGDFLQRERAAGRLVSGPSA
jgi:hypothetical protein